MFPAPLYLTAESRTRTAMLTDWRGGARIARRPRSLHRSPQAHIPAPRGAALLLCLSLLISAISVEALRPIGPITSGVTDISGEALLGLAPTNYTVTFEETGLPSGTFWQAVMFSVVDASTTSTITYAEPNGTYSYAVYPISGYTIHYPGPNELTVAGHPVVVEIEFVSSSPSKNPGTVLGLPETEGLAIILAGLAAVALSSAVLVLRVRRRRR